MAKSSNQITTRNICGFVIVDTKKIGIDHQSILNQNFIEGKIRKFFNTKMTHLHC